MLFAINDNNLPGSPGERLTRNDVQRILAAAASQMRTTQVVTVVDREGEILGMLAGPGARLGANDQTGTPNPLVGTLGKSLTRARTGAAFASREDAFSTRTARFIIQDNFPWPVPNTPGGPLYGVQFSTLPGSDFARNSLGTSTGPTISGDPGGLPLFKNGEPVGGIGVAGDGADVLVRANLPYDPTVTSPSNVFAGNEERDFDEAVALAGVGSRFAAPTDIRANKILIDGLRFPYTFDRPAVGAAGRTLTQLQAGGFVLVNPNQAAGLDVGRNSAIVRGSPASAYPTATFAGVPGELKNQRAGVAGDRRFGIFRGGIDASPLDDTNEDGVVDSRDPQLSRGDVEKVIKNAVAQAIITRAAIRRPIGVPVRVHIAVVDRSGSPLGVFRMDDGTNFSYDVAVQKARTAAFFSDNTHAMSSRAVGFLSQGFFPVGINKSRGGPMFEVQNELSLSILNGGGFTNPRDATRNPLANGMTIFPGGAPLYKDGVLVGAIGISGDGVDQDDIIAYNGTKGFRPTERILSNNLGAANYVAFMKSKTRQIFSLYPLDTDLANASQRKTLGRFDALLQEDFVRLPYVKFPRNWEL
jgi:uncharacterized protein GlcG (DUF336 family)